MIISLPKLYHFSEAMASMCSIQKNNPGLVKKMKNSLKSHIRKKDLILTHDSDSGSLTIHEGKRYYGIIYIRVRYLHPQNVIKVCEQLLNLKTELAPGTIIVVEEARLRIRKFDVN